MNMKNVGAILNYGYVDRVKDCYSSPLQNRSLSNDDHYLSAGQEAAKVSVYFIFASLFTLTLLLSKMSSNIKSLVKDDHWMQRIELVFDRLGRAGVQVQESIVDIMHDASMSNYAWPQYNTSAAPGNQTFGLAGGYGGGMGAKAAIAPPSSVPEDAHDAIAAGNYTTENTIDGLPHGRGR